VEREFYNEWIMTDTEFQPVIVLIAEDEGLLRAVVAEFLTDAGYNVIEAGVRFLTYSFDEARGTGFCLIGAPNIETAMRATNTRNYRGPRVTAISRKWQASRTLVVQCWNARPLRVSLLAQQRSGYAVIGWLLLSAMRCLQVTPIQRRPDFRA
jgi:hypothetical protein